MKVFLISDYFYPFTPGGSEWSVFELAKALQSKKIKAVVATINYGAKSSETYQNIKILRIPFLKKIKNKRKAINPIWQNNPIFFIISAYYLYKMAKLEEADIIHVHGKYLIPGSVVAGFFAKKPVIVTIRDKQIFCPIGKCFFNTKRKKSCSFIEFITSDFPWFVDNYTDKNPLNIAYAFLGSIWSRVSGITIKFFAKKANVITTISYSQKKYMEANGFKSIKVIYNTSDFKKTKKFITKTKNVLFVGKVSNGKGAEILLKAMEVILKKRKINFVFAGLVESPKIRKKLNTKSLKNNIKLLGAVSHSNLPIYYKNASVVAMPSIYPESFGRTALEALSYGTPAIVTNIGGLPEIIQDKITGRVIKPSSKSLNEAIIEVIDNEKKYKKNVEENYILLKKKFKIDPINKYINLYKEQIK